MLIEPFRYDFYYDVYLGGQYLFKIQELHRKYGPIIRITPHEIHVSDPAFYGTLYASARHKRNRDPYHTNAISVPGSVLASPPHDLHRRRRAALSPLFSMGSTRRLIPVVEERVACLIDRFVGLRGGEAVDVGAALSAFSNGTVLPTSCRGA